MTKRWLSLLLVVVLSLNFAALLPNGAAVVRAADVPDIAAYAPPDSVAFVMFRTDDAFIDQIDELRRQIIRALPQGMMPEGISLRTLIALGFQAAGVNFESDVRPWLGDQGALFVGGLAEYVGKPNVRTEDLPIAFVVAVKDRAAATNTIDEIIATAPGAKDMLKKADEGINTVYRPARSGVDGALAINDNALIIGTEAGIDAALATRAKLFEQAEFKDTLALLPEKSYNLLAYFNMPEIFRSLLLPNAMGDVTTFAGDQKVTEAVFSAIGPIAMGATILDDRTLTLDSAQKVGDFSKLEALGVTMPKLTAIDPAFAAMLPSNAAAVIHGTNLTGIIDNSIANLKAFAKLQGADQEAMIEKQIAQFEAELLKNTGINLRDDVLSWLTGDFALVSGYQTPAVGAATIFTAPFYTPGTTLAQPFDIGLVFEATDATKAAALSAKLEALLAMAVKNSKEATLTSETVGGTKVTLLSVTQPLDTNSPAISFEVMIAANDKVFMIGTRRVVENILTGFPGLDTGATYLAAAKYLLPNPYAVFYLSGDGFNLIGDLVTLVAAGRQTAVMLVPRLAETPTPGTPTVDPKAEMLKEFETAQTLVRTITALFESATISATQTEGGDTLSRAVITLAK